MSQHGDSNVESTILRAESVAAWREGEHFLEQAKREAAEVLKQANADAQRIREQARKEGFDEGRKAGMEDAGRLAVQLVVERDAYLKSLTSRLVKVLDASVRKILGELNDIALIEGAARTAIQSLRHSGRVTLRVPAATVDVLKESVGFSDMHHVCVVGDDALQGDACLLETSQGTIELSAHAQWERIFQGMSEVKGRADD